MSWIAISDGRRFFRLPKDRDPLLPVGSLVIEALPSHRTNLRQQLLLLDRDTEWRHKLSVTLSGDGEIEVEHIQGRSRFYAVLDAPRMTGEDNLRLTFSWDAPKRIAHLTVESLSGGTLQTATFDDPLPMPVEDVIALSNCARLDPNLSLLAVSDTIEPVGPAPSFLESSTVETAVGPRAIADLRPGDLVTTMSGRLLPVQQVVSREVPAFGQFRPVCLRAPFLGLSTDLHVAPHHRVLLHGTDTEYLFGTETALLEVRHLGPMLGDPVPDSGLTIRYWQVLLEEHDCIRTNGAWTESLFVGNLIRRPARYARSLLSHLPKTEMPVHTGKAGPLLRRYEAMVLVSNLCA